VTKVDLQACAGFRCLVIGVESKNRACLSLGGEKRSWGSCGPVSKV
jgi:hypothetical protein